MTKTAFQSARERTLKAMTVAKRLAEQSSRSPGCYHPGSMPEGWGLWRHVEGEIVVTHKDGSGVLIRKGSERDDTPIAETLFYRMMDDILKGAGG